MKKILFVLLSLILLGFIYANINYIEINKRGEDLYTIHQNTVNDAEIANMITIVETANWPMAMVESEEEGIVIYLNDAYYKFLELDKSLIYTNNILDENYLYIPIIPDVVVLPISENNSGSKIYTTTYVNTQGENIDTLINELNQKTNLIFEAQHFNHESNSYIFFMLLLMILLIYAFLTLYLFEKNKNKHILYKLGGISNTELSKICNRELFPALVVSIILLVISFFFLAINLHAFSVALVSTIITIIITFILYKYESIFLIRKFNELKMSELINGKDVFNYTKHSANIITVFSKITFALLMLVLLIFSSSILSNLKALPLWIEVKDYQYISEQSGIVCEGDMITCDSEYRTNFVKEQEQVNNAIYSFYEDENFVMTNYNMMALQYDEAQQLDPNLNYLIVPTSYNVDEVVAKVDERYSNSEDYGADIGNVLDYTVIVKDIKPMYSFDPVEGYYSEDSVYYVTGYESTYYDNNLVAYQELYYSSDVEVNPYDYPFTNPEIVEETSMTKPVIIFYIFEIVMLLFAIILMVLTCYIYTNGLKKVVIINFKRNAKENALMRLNGVSSQKLYKKVFSKQFKINIFFMIVTVPISLVLFTIFGPIVMVIMLLVFLIYFIIDPFIIKKVIKETERDLLIDIIKGKND